MSDTVFIKNLTWEKVNELIASHTEEIVSDQLCATPLISVLVHTYQHAEYIQQCMEGILAQKTAFAFEIVIGDDGSTDGAYSIVKEYQEKHPHKIRLLHSTPNMGRYTGSGIINVIRSIRACRGKYIAFIEGDDYWTSTLKLERQVSLLEENPDYSASIHDVEIIGDWNGEEFIFDHGKNTLITFSEQLTDAAPLAFGSLIGKREVLADLPDWYLKTPYQDRFCMALLASTGPVIRIPEKLGVYRRHAGGITASKEFYNFSTTARVWEMHWNCRNYFHPAGYEYYDRMMRRSIGQLLRASRRPSWNFKQLGMVMLMLLRMPPSQWWKTYKELSAERLSAGNLSGH